MLLPGTSLVHGLMCRILERKKRKGDGEDFLSYVQDSSIFKNVPQHINAPPNCRVLIPLGTRLDAGSGLVMNAPSDSWAFPRGSESPVEGLGMVMAFPTPHSSLPAPHLSVALLGIPAVS